MRLCLSILICFCLLFSGCAPMINSSDVSIPPTHVFKKSTQCSKQGDGSALFNKGYAYANGQNMPRDEVKAVQWYRQSAEQCYAPAEFMLGLAYERGKGVIENKTEALRWYQKADEQGFHNASQRLIELKKDERIAQIIAKEEWVTTGDLSLGYGALAGALAGGLNSSSIFSELERENLISIKVFYGTDRTTQGSTIPKKFFGNQRGNLVFGTCEVSIPRDHKMGEVESPSWLKFQFKESPEQHVLLLEVNPQSEKYFFSSLRSRIKGGVKLSV